MNIHKICDVLENGGLVISPTDTVYGIMGDAMNESVIKNIYEAKNRPYSKPLILLMDSYKMIEEYTSNISEIERAVIDKFMPGLVTIILKKNDKVSNFITGNGEYVGIRIPKNEDLLKIINRLGRPVVSTSANMSDYDVVTRVDLLDERLRGKIDYIEDGGEVISESSTIIKFDNGKLIILRDGKMSDEVRNYVDILG